MCIVNIIIYPASSSKETDGYIIYTHLQRAVVFFFRISFVLLYCRISIEKLSLYNVRIIIYHEDRPYKFMPKNRLIYIATYSNAQITQE